MHTPVQPIRTRGPASRVTASTKGPGQYSFKTESNERATRAAAREGQRGSKSESRRVTVGDPAAGCRQHSYNTTRPREPTHRATIPTPPLMPIRFSAELSFRAICDAYSLRCHFKTSIESITPVDHNVSKVSSQLGRP